jgi:transposase
VPRPHPPEFRQRAVELANQRGPDGNRLQPVAKTAADLGISDSCLRNWIAQAAIDAGNRPGLSTDERRELVELRRRTRVLEMENEILKRASAYFARENVLPK